LSFGAVCLPVGRRLASTAPAATSLRATDGPTRSSTTASVSRASAQAQDLREVVAEEALELRLLKNTR
jgi:hypothetical protein